MTFFVSYIAALTASGILDYIWLGNIGIGFYRRDIGHLLKEQLDIVSGSLFYIIFPAFLVYFALLPAIEKNSLKLAVLNGAMFGFICFFTYNITNLATIKDWSSKVIFYDTAWGTFLGAVVCVSGYLAVKWIIKS